MDLFNTIFRTWFFYFFITVSYRLMGKREVGQLGIIDLIVSILIAELVAISIENTSSSIMLTLTPILMLIGLEIIFAFISLKSRRFRIFFQGKPALIICDGKINYHELIKQRYSLDDLLLNLRLQKIKSIEDVEFAFLETNGKLSIFAFDKKYKKIFPHPVILDGLIINESLRRTGYTKNKLLYLLKENNLELKDIFYGFYKDKKIFIINKNKKDSFLSNKNINLQPK